jgi:hypothetical protein
MKYPEPKESVDPVFAGVESRKDDEESTAAVYSSTNG